jgi:hypothetical protein
MELRPHSSVCCHLLAIHGTPTQDEGNVIQNYYRFSIFDIKSILFLHYYNVESMLAGRRDVPFQTLPNKETRHLGSELQIGYF